MAQQQQEALKMVAELEVEMMSDMYRRMTKCCQQKCVNSQYREAELTKGESICIDRCVAKYMDVHERLGKVLTQMTQQDDRAVAQVAHEQNKT
ncbi:tim10/DDP family zinc finger domain-containing protein [Ditylenchus destructor]|nr:tim10/DDP family zinc finger domain-containing protein [Ditylenchus destructor]